MKKKSLRALIIVGLVSVAINAHAAGFLSDMFSALLGNTPSQPAPETPSSDTGYLSESQAKSYVEQIIETIIYEFNPVSTDAAYLKTLIRKTVLESSQVYSYSTYGKKQYKRDLIDQYIAGALLEYIETKSYNYTLQRTNDKSVARRISQSMRGNAMAIVNQSGTLNPGQLKKFVGTSLQKAVDDHLMSTQNVPVYAPKPSAPPAYEPPPAYTAPKPSAPPAYELPPAYTPKPTVSSTEREYPSQDCCACMESFTSVERVFLRPCGHDMCKNCVFQWFFGKERKKTCPTCRGTVNLDRLAQDLT